MDQKLRYLNERVRRPLSTVKAASERRNVW